MLPETDAEMIAKRLMDAVANGGIGMNLNLLKTELIAGFALVDGPGIEVDMVASPPTFADSVLRVQQYLRERHGDEIVISRDGVRERDNSLRKGMIAQKRMDALKADLLRSVDPPQFISELLMYP